MKVLFKLDENKKVISITGFEKEVVSPYNLYVELNENELNTYGNLVGRLFYENGKFVEKQTTSAQELNKYERIVLLKNILSNSDYKIIKCMEAKLINAEMPYDYAEIIKEREAIRQELRILGE